MNKKAITGSGITWIVATFVVLVLAVFYLIGISGLTFNKISSGPSEINVKEPQTTNLEIQKSLVSFLNKKVIYENTELTISQLIAQSDLKNENTGKIFQVHSESTFNKLLSNENSNTSESWWFRIYEKNEAPSQYPPETKFNSGGSSCNPENLEESIILSQFIGDKRSVFCLNKKHYNELENSRTK